MSLGTGTSRRERSPCLAAVLRGTGLAAIIAAIGWTALAIEFWRSVTGSLHHGRSLAEALFLYFRYFTILTNLGVATLMTIATVCIAARRPLPPARIFNAALAYILVTCVTYEIMLRSQWTPRGLQLLTDTAIHDIVPILMLAFWLGFAPRAGTRWRDALWGLAYPALYLALTLLAGAMGEGYPYSFLDVHRLGYAGVLPIAAMFLAIFYALGLATTALSIAWSRGLEGRDNRCDLKTG